MADDVNKSGGRYNQIGAAASMDEIFSRVSRESEVNTVAGARLRSQGSAERSRLRQIQQTYNILSSAPGASTDPGIQEAIAQNRDEYAESVERRRQIADRFHQEKQFAQVRSQNVLVSQVQQFTGQRQQTSRINEVFGSSAAAEMASRSIGSGSYSDFERQQQAGMRTAREAAINLREAAASGAPQNRLRELGAQMSEAEGQIGVARRGMQIARQMGFDPQSQFMRINEVSTRANDRMGMEKIREQAAAGELPSLKELQQAIKATAEELNGLKDQFNKGEMSLEEFNKKAGESADAMQKLEQQERAVQQAGGGGRRYGDIARDIVGLGGAAVNAAQQIGVNQPIQRMNNVAQMANISNQQYGTLRSAMMGDMSALSLIESGAFERAGDFASQIGNRQKFIKGAEGVVTVADAAVEGGLQMGEGASLGNLGGGTVSKTVRGGLTIAKGVVNAAPVATDVMNQITETQSYVNAYQSALEAQKALQAVPAQFRQSFFDFGQNVNAAGRQAGGGREAMSTVMMSDRFQDDMMKFGIDPNRAAALTGQGFAEQGSAFQMMPQLQMARNLERQGFGSMEQNFSRMGQLAGAGARDPQAAMGKIMEEAVSRGMDSSKAISLMVDATSSLAGRSGAGAAGIDVTGSLADMVGRLVGTARGEGKSEIGAAAAAQNAADAMNRGLTDSSTTFTNMMRDTRLRQMGMTGLEAASAKTLDMTSMQALQKGVAEGASEEERQAAKDIARQAGLKSMFDKSGNLNKNQVNKFFDVQSNFLQLGGASGVGLTATAEDRNDPMVQSQIARLGLGAQNTTGVNDFLAGKGGLTADQQKKAQDRLAGKAGTTSEQLEDINAQAGRHVSKEIKEGNKGLGGVEGLAKKLSDLEKAITPDVMANFSTAAGKAAEDLNINTGKFKELSTAAGNLTTSMNGLNTAIDNIIKKTMTTSGSAMNKQMNEANKSTKQRADGKPGG